MEVHQGFGPLGPGLLPRHLTLESCHFGRQRVVLLGGGPPLLLGESFQFPFAPLRPPGLYIREIQPLAPKQGPDFPRLLAGVCFPQNLQLVLGRKPPPRRLRHDLGLPGHLSRNGHSIRCTHPQLLSRPLL